MGYVGFGVLAVIAVAAGVAVFVVNSMARATFALAASFVAVGCELFLLNAGYLAVITVLMMVMEMAIMAVFMVAFMMNPAGLMPMSMMHNKRGALVISAVVFAGLAAGAIGVPWPHRQSRAPARITEALGQSLMGPKMLVMIAVSAVLFATMVSALTLASGRGRYDRPRPGAAGQPAEQGRVRPGTVSRDRTDAGRSS